ncbi:ABC transporter ATP-binding protein [Rouxiella chamberiensis]|uniref:ABC-type dipeptide transporter n=1 Tax=Rouxiella chamberiensis TaxID=1513468 RepID=A0ABY7HST3_9GAMM|nr:ABC transporter ATP-binding protein [Rouxiella chamberiensis]WAT02072.1 ABC transporter ATP-binding protein [Rouxiella chamberiensis]
MNPLLSIQELGVRFGQHRAVDGLSLTLARGKMLALVGESGCGKSATALSILGLLPAYAQVSGTMTYEGQNLLTLSSRKLRALRGNEIAMVFQEPMTSLNPVQTVGQQIIETLHEHLGLSGRMARTRAIELLDRVELPNPDKRVDYYPHQLSGGQRQRVMIAMAVACEPKLLIADEPTTALDVTVQGKIMALIDDLRKSMSMSVLMISHDLGLMSRWADEVAVMHGGRKLEQNHTRELFAEPRHEYTRGLLAASLHSQHDVHYRQRRLTEIRTLQGQSERSFSLYTPPTLRFPPLAHTAPSQPILSAQEVNVSYTQGGQRIDAVSDVSFDLFKGETLGLVGESGCGKSTLSRAILHLVNPDSGHIRLNGIDTVGLKESQLGALRSKVQMIFQDPFASLNPRQTVGGILDRVLKVSGVKDKTQRKQRIAFMVDRVGLPQNSLNRFAHEFSGGQRQRIGIARALITQPELIICDEAVSALDVSIQAQILNLLLEMKHEFGLSYLFISHNLDVVRYMADRVLVMQKGKIVESGEVETVWNRPQHPYTRELLEAVDAEYSRQRKQHLEIA